MATTRLAKMVGNAVVRAGNSRWRWYTPLMASASSAISQRMPHVDFVLEVRDARIPLSSHCPILHPVSSSSSRHIIVFNKLDLANASCVKEWINYFQQQNCLAFAVNSHNKQSVQLFLNFLQSQVRALSKVDPKRNTITMMLVGIPNVGKSALTNALHQIGRITAAEKGKLKHAVVSPLPGDTTSISSLKIASHPSIYVLDTPGVLPPQMTDIDVSAKLALTGALTDNLAGEKALAQYFLSILNSGKEHEKWKKLSAIKLTQSVKDDIIDTQELTEMPRIDTQELTEMPREEPCTDHTKDSVVQRVRRVLVEDVSSFKGSLQNEDDMLGLVQAEFSSLREVFSLPLGSQEDTDQKVATKLLNLFRTGRLGQYTLDSVNSL